MKPDKIKQFANKEDSSKLTLSDFFDISDLSRQVGENTSDIKKLKEQSEKLESVKVEVVEVRTRQSAIEEKLNAVETGINDIKKDSSGFRKFLLSTAIGLLIAIFGTLKFGLDFTRSDQATLKNDLEKKIEASDKKHDKNYDNISSKIDKITDLIIQSKASK